MREGIIFDNVKIMSIRVNRNVKVKICGNKRLEDAMKAINLGADAVGLLVGQGYASRDFISPLAAQSIAMQLPPFATVVLVTNITDVNEMIGMVNFIGVNTLQLHGDSSTADIARIKKSLPYIKIIKSLHVTDDSSMVRGKKYVGIADAVVLDSFDKAANKIGGTGRIHDWSISKRIVQEYNLPTILAGGLNPDNVAEAVREVGPYGVDVNTGTKGEDGFKDYKKLELFIRRAKELRNVGDIL